MSQAFLLFLTALLLQTRLFAAECLDSNPQKNLKAIGAVHQVYEESPFMVACKEPKGLLSGRPQTGLLKRSMIENDSHGRTSRDFLKRVLQRIKLRVEESTNQIHNIEKCMGSASPACVEIQQWVKNDLPRFLKSARYHLSLAQSPSQIDSWDGRSSKRINEDLESLGSYKFQNWSPLTKAELDRAHQQLASYHSQILAEMKTRKELQGCSKCQAKFITDSTLSVRYQHYMTYRQMMGELPLLQHLKGPDVTESDLKSAFQTMKSNLSKETQNLENYQHILDSPGPLSTDALEILNYSSEVEEELMNDNRDCALASSLVFTRSNRQIGNALAVGLPILAVSFFAPPALGLLMGVGAGSTFAFASYQNFQRAQVQSLGHIYGDSLHTDLTTLESTSKQKNYDVVTLPLGLGLGSIAARSLTVMGKSLSAGTKIFQRASNIKE
jgi:hypothetical protein